MTDALRCAWVMIVREHSLRLPFKEWEALRADVQLESEDMAIVDPEIHEQHFLLAGWPVFLDKDYL